MNRRELVGLMGLSAGNFALAQPGVRPSLIGIWTLQTCVRTFADGHKEYPFGEKPIGHIGTTKERPDVCATQCVRGGDRHWRLGWSWIGRASKKCAKR